MQTAESRLLGFEALQRRQGLGYAPQVAQAGAFDEQKIAVVWQRTQQALGVAQSFIMTSLVLKPSQPADFQLHRDRGRA
jgi:hypothetical protein